MVGPATLKTQMREVCTPMLDLEVGEIDPLLSNFMNGVRRMPGTWTPKRWAEHGTPTKS